MLQHPARSLYFVAGFRTEFGLLFVAFPYHCHVIIAGDWLPVAMWGTGQWFCVVFLIGYCYERHLSLPVTSWWVFVLWLIMGTLVIELSNILSLPFFLSHSHSLSPVPMLVVVPRCGARWGSEHCYEMRYWSGVRGIFNIDLMSWPYNSAPLSAVLFWDI